MRISHKVAIVGAGFVGSTAAYALMLSGVVAEIALIDKNREKAEGEALDLMNCMQFTNAVTISAGDDYSLVKDASVVILSAGFAQKPGQLRTDLLAANVNIFKEIVPLIAHHNKDCILLVVTNPLDVLTYVTWRLSKFPACRVFGTGTVLDSARLRYVLGKQFQISPKDITAHILGEHGQSEFVWWSKANIAGVPIIDLPGYQPAAMQTMYEETRDAAATIISKKGSTYYAIALVITKIVRAIVLDQSRVFTVSTINDNIYGVNEVCLSVPTVVRKSGTCERLPLALDGSEQKLLIQSAQKIRAEIELAITLL